MGPTNTALVKLFRADQDLRAARERLDAASKNVRIQERRVGDLTERLKAAQLRSRELQSHAGQLDLDLKSRDAHIEKLRAQQQTARNQKEYQAFLVEINTAKVDRGKAEDEAVKLMEQVEKAQAEVTALQAQLAGEQAKLQALASQSEETIAKLRAEVESLRPAREQAAAALPPSDRLEFERLSERHDGEAMAPIAKPDPRREEYVCTACNMDLMTDVYNKLRTRDQRVLCPNCRRILFIPEQLTPDLALGTKPAGRGGRAAAAGVATAAGEGGSAVPKTRKPRVQRTAPAERRAKGKLGEVLSKAQAESVKAAVGGGGKPVECEVVVDGKPAGVYKGKTREHLERSIQVFLEEAGMTAQVQVIEKPAAAGAVPEATSTASAEPTAVAGPVFAPDPVSPPPAPAEPDTTPPLPPATAPELSAPAPAEPRSTQSPGGGTGETASDAGANVSDEPRDQSGSPSEEEVSPARNA